MTEETTQTFDVYGEPDYSDILEDIRSEAQFRRSSFRVFTSLKALGLNIFRPIFRSSSKCPGLSSVRLSRSHYSDG